jgi:hypothetical protein
MPDDFKPDVTVEEPEVMASARQSLAANISPSRSATRRRTRPSTSGNASSAAAGSTSETLVLDHEGPLPHPVEDKPQ